MKIYSQEEVKTLLEENLDRFYVYGLHRPDKDEIFYIGKGRGWRIFVHLDVRIETFNTHKIRIIQKVGPENIKFLIKFVNSEEDAFEFEKKLISRYGRSQLCNKTDGGEGLSGYVWSEESKKRKSQVYKALYNSERGEQLKQKIRESSKRFYSTPEGEAVRQKMCDNRKGELNSNYKNSGENSPLFGKKRPEHSERMTGENNPFKGKHHSEETRKKNSEKVKEWYKINGHPAKGKRMSLEDREKCRQIQIEYWSTHVPVMKGRVTCFDMIRNKMLSVPTERYNNFKNIRYFSPKSNAYKKWKTENKENE